MHCGSRRRLQEDEHEHRVAKMRRFDGVCSQIEEKLFLGSNTVARVSSTGQGGAVAAVWAGGLTASAHSAPTSLCWPHREHAFVRVCARILRTGPRL